MAETFGWRDGLWTTRTAKRGIYAIPVGATLIGTAVDFTPLDPIKALFYSALANGVIAVPIMTMLMLLASKPEVLGPFVRGRPLKALGGSATALIPAAVAGMFWSMLS